MKIKGKKKQGALKPMPRLTPRQHKKKKISAHSPSLASTCREPCTSQSLPLNMPCNAGWRPFLLQATLA